MQCFNEQPFRRRSVIVDASKWVSLCKDKLTTDQDHHNFPSTSKSIQKQLPYGILKNKYFEKIPKIHTKPPATQSFFRKTVVIGPAVLLKKNSIVGVFPSTLRIFVKQALRTTTKNSSFYLFVYSWR